VSCAYSKHYPPENYVTGALSDSLKLMAGWVLGWLSAVRTRLRKRLDLLHAGPSAAHHSRPRLRLDYGRSTTFTVALEAITDTQAAGIHEFCTTNRYRARASGPQFLQRDCTARLPQTTRPKANDPQCPSPTRRPFLRVSSRGQGYEKPQVPRAGPARTKSQRKASQAPARKCHKNGPETLSH
jgi:hypothetical protein